MSAQDAARSAAEVRSLLRDYIDAFVRGTRDDLQAFVKLPVAYITDHEVQMRERYPFDPEKLRTVTGIARSEVDINVLHANHSKAHVEIKGTRQKSDGTVVEGIEAIYVLNRIEGEWKITALSGIRVPPSA